MPRSNLFGHLVAGRTRGHKESDSTASGPKQSVPGRHLNRMIRYNSADRYPESTDSEKCFLIGLSNCRVWLLHTMFIRHLVGKFLESMLSVVQNLIDQYSILNLSDSKNPVQRMVGKFH